MELSKTKRPFQQARKFVQALKLKSIAEWNQYCKSGKKPPDIPANPTIYNKEWTKWGDWLGTGTLSSTEKSKNWLSAKEARIEIRKIAKEVFGAKLAKGKKFTPKDWEDAHDAGKIPKNLPKYLDDIYNPDVKKRRKERRSRK